MVNYIMMFSGITLLLLFIFLLFIFFTVIISIFKKQKKYTFQPNISILIPCYNEEKNIKKCLDAIFTSKYDKKKIEVVVIDDGSTDNTLNIIKKYKKNNLKIVKGKHKGKSPALNLGVKKAKHDFIITLDADTIVEKTAIKKLVAPFENKDIGATNGSSLARNKETLLTDFQRVEYYNNNLIRKAFSDLFNTGIWFFGAFAAYRRNVLKKIGYFKTDTMTEDMDIALEIYDAGYKIHNVYDAFGFTIVPKTIKEFIKQRTRWWYGVLQALKKNKKLFSKKSNPSILFLFINQYWWTYYAIVSLPIIVYQYNFWLSSNLGSFFQWFMYTFRWFSLLGSLHVIYMIPVWGISFYSIFGVLSGIISIFTLSYAIILFKGEFSLKNLVVLFFYFPYTILLNTIIVLSIIKGKLSKNKHFIS